MRMSTRGALPLVLVALGAPRATAAPEPVRVRIEFIVEDARRQPVVDLKSTEVVVHQGDDREGVESFERGAAPGHYAVSYMPRSRQVRTAEGKDIQRFSLDYPIEVPETQKLLLAAQRVVWTTHLHLPAGPYVLETACQDLLSAPTGVRRTSFDAAPSSPGLRMSSISVMQAAEALSKEQGGIDNPLEYLGHQLVPAHRAQYVAGGLGELRFFVVLYPKPSAKGPVDLSLELYRDGALVGRGPVALPPAEPGKGIPYLGSFRLQSRPVGAYELKLTARQGTMSADETAVFDLVPVPRLEALPRP
jgi:hypothetical protein